MEIPDQAGRVALVTGANSGIGLETARALAGAGATVLLAGRSLARLEPAVADVMATTGNDGVHAIVLDLSSLTSVREAAERILSERDGLDLLINNAGVVLSGRSLSADGYELTFATNHLGHFLLTELLLERLVSSAPARIVNVASTAHRAARRLDFDDLQSEQSYSAMTAYNRSKLANVLFTQELARRLEGTGVSAFSVHPGTVRTRWAQDGDMGGLMKAGVAIARPFFLGPRAGAGATLYAATAPGIESRSGGYFQRAAFGQYGAVREANASAAGRDADAARRLWQVSEQLVGTRA